MILGCLGCRAMEEKKLSRSEVAKRLGVSKATIRRREGTELHPTIGPRGERAFDPKEVEALASAARVTKKRPQTKGEIAAWIFELIDQQKSLAEIVKTTRQPPDVVRKLYRERATGFEKGERERRAREDQRRADFEEDLSMRARELDQQIATSHEAAMKAHDAATVRMEELDRKRASNERRTQDALEQLQRLLLDRDQKQR